MSEYEQEEKIAECDGVFDKEKWLPSAAKRAGQISMATHPCRFSHPSAKKNKNGETTSVISDSQHTNDGYLRSGNVESEIDALGNAAALDVYKFLTLIMSDNQTLLQHIKQDSHLAQNTLSIKSESYDKLKAGFMAMTEAGSENITSSKIKQVYFPINPNDSYHLLSVLTNSGIVFESRKRVDALRFPAEEEKTLIKEARECKGKELHHTHRWKEVYGLTTIGYGGTKPQNISVLNTQNGGRSHLFSSMPPTLKKRDLHFPTTDFFSQSLDLYLYRNFFQKLHRLYLTPTNNLKVRNARDSYFGDLSKKIQRDRQAVLLVD